MQPCTQDGYTRVDVKCGCNDCYCWSLLIVNCRSFNQIVQVMFAAGSRQMQWLILPIFVVFANLCFRSVLFLLFKNSGFPFEQFNFLLRISSQNQTAGYRSSCCYSKWSWLKWSVDLWSGEFNAPGSSLGASWEHPGSNLGVLWLFRTNISSEVFNFIFSTQMRGEGFEV